MYHISPGVRLRVVLEVISGVGDCLNGGLVDAGTFFLGFNSVFANGHIDGL